MNSSATKITDITIQRKTLMVSIFRVVCRDGCATPRLIVLRKGRGRRATSRLIVLREGRGRRATARSESAGSFLRVPARPLEPQVCGLVAAPPVTEAVVYSRSPRV